MQLYFTAFLHIAQEYIHFAPNCEEIYSLKFGFKERKMNLLDRGTGI